MKNVSQHLLHLMHYRKYFFFQPAMDFNHIPAKLCMNAWDIFLSFFCLNSISMLGKNVYRDCPLKQQNTHPITMFLE